ncbi:MAG: GGDEF domain-containing protein [Pseudomonadota bacterium]|nr:MAG: GGDEF domain-containing protein [Pseudomonadota bacterium]
MDKQANMPSRETLAALPLLAGAAPEILDWLARHCSVSDAPAGTLLLSPEQTNDRAFVVLEGRLEVHLANQAPEAHTWLEAGSCVGEMSIIEGTYPSATVVTASDCRLLAIEGEVLWSLINRSHAVARNLLYTLSARVRQDNRVIEQSLQQQRQFEKSAQTDALTGLWNRRWLDEMLPRMADRCVMNNQPLSLLILDIDHFKSYNDTHGHLAGDRALQTVAATLSDRIRPTDVAARYGGEEFVVIMPDTARDGARIIAERLCIAIREQPIVRADESPLPAVTVSIGLGTLTDERSAEQLFEAADAALYRAKNAGRNQVAA